MGGRDRTLFWNPQEAQTQSLSKGGQMPPPPGFFCRGKKVVCGGFSKLLLAREKPTCFFQGLTNPPLSKSNIGEPPKTLLSTRNHIDRKRPSRRENPPSAGDLNSFEKKPPRERQKIGKASNWNEKTVRKGKPPDPWGLLSSSVWKLKRELKRKKEKGFSEMEDARRRHRVDRTPLFPPRKKFPIGRGKL